MSTIFEVYTGGGKSRGKKVSRCTGGIYINFFIFLFIYIGRRKVDRTRNDAGLRLAGSWDRCGKVGQMSHALFLGNVTQST